MKVLLWLWQVPQHLLGLLIILITRAKKQKVILPIYWVASKIPAGISLGQYIIVRPEDKLSAVQHEYGHSRQSLMFGPLYLLAVGLPSIVRNIYDRIAHKRWLPNQRYLWYYMGYPEMWADRLGGVGK